MQAPEQLAQAIELIEIAWLRCPATSSGKQGETKPGMLMQAGTVVDQRRHHGHFVIGQFEGKAVLFQDGFVGPALRTIKLGDQLYRLGQLLGRLHAIGATRPFEHREALGVKNFGHDSLETVLNSGFVPTSLLPAYESVARDLLKRVEDAYAATPHRNIRMHGDCHPGNMMCRDEVFHIVDLDDCRMGPAVQDLWMMLAGDRQECLGQLSELMDGYQEFHDFDPRELALIEPLRALRLMHYSAWLARRWDDPAFPRSFPWFGSERYWGDQVLALREQLAALNEEPLKLF
jgi:Ser/Thr protein kinase RdoA (MazF antagonist)